MDINIKANLSRLKLSNSQTQSEVGRLKHGENATSSLVIAISVLPVLKSKKKTLFVRLTNPKGCDFAARRTPEKFEIIY